MPPKAGDLKDRIRASVRIDDNGCWIWQKYVRPNGYGQIGVPGRGGQYVHRIAYEQWRGPLEDGLQIDHLCRVRRCCNPDHLEQVTGRVNLLRGEGFSARHARITRCPKGHPYDEANTYLRRNDSARDCKACRTERNRNYNAVAGRRLAEVPVKQRTATAARPLKASCPAGHPYSGDNLYVSPRGNQQCRTCRREACRRSYAQAGQR